MSTASKAGYDLALIIGKKEFEEKVVTVKDLRTGHQTRVASDEVVREIVEKLAKI